MIRARMVFCGRGREAERAALSLQPDNLPNMHLITEEERMTLEFSTEKIGTMLSTIDDLLMNIKIAEDTLVSGEE